MKVFSVFNNKGGVGKTTLTFHLAHSLAAQGYKILMIDADPQCNLTIYSVDQEKLHGVWEEEDIFIEMGYEQAAKKIGKESAGLLDQHPRSLHYILKPVEDGVSDVEIYPPPLKIADNLDLIPGRLTLHLYEEKVAERWAGAYRGDPLAIRTLTKIREVAKKYGEINNYDYIIVDTSPSLGSLNKVVISTVDGFIVPAAPDLFSLYGIRNLGHALSKWKSEFDVIYTLISPEKRVLFPERFVTFLGYTIYNAKKRSDRKNKWNLAKAHFNYAEQIPGIVRQYLPEAIRLHLTDSQVDSPIGGASVMHTHNTLPAMAQKYNSPMWKIPDASLDVDDIASIRPNSENYKNTFNSYKSFCVDLLDRINLLDVQNEPR